ncbi:uncharacterized protein BXZ73DRAFT_74162 [Epithele typhae]|uniref:uncharacterized protein n=1 Tax=Epithele typhae TaxID=378194 RepID=UPI0020078CBB|nr:uncharacterized protein BXZ73DRAFT_74162 [Epithele typhae]KAH9943133.1 hypothetical protein BXZ73DRAFT_74162 [Epithele typhae]
MSGVAFFASQPGSHAAAEFDALLQRIENPKASVTAAAAADPAASASSEASTPDPAPSAAAGQNPMRMVRETRGRVRRAETAVLAAQAGLDEYSVHVTTSKRNTVMTLTRGERTLLQSTPGKFGFKKAARGGYEPAYRCALAVVAKMEREMKKGHPVWWRLNLSGFGSGRDAIAAVVEGPVGTKVRERLTRLTDRTPIKIGGDRGKKERRL